MPQGGDGACVVYAPHFRMLRPPPSPLPPPLYIFDKFLNYFFSPAPSAPQFLNHTLLAPNKLHGPSVNLTWSRPEEANGIIRSYTVFYSQSKSSHEMSFGSETQSHSLDVLGEVTYQFHVRAVTIKPGPNATLTVHIPVYGTFSFRLFIVLYFLVLFLNS